VSIRLAAAVIPLVPSYEQFWLGLGAAAWTCGGGGRDGERAAFGPNCSGPASESPPSWWILSVLGVAQLMAILDSTIVNVALPTAQHALKFSNADRQWIVAGYSLSPDPPTNTF
jgi:hypothetical protein